MDNVSSMGLTHTKKGGRRSVRKGLGTPIFLYDGKLSRWTTHFTSPLPGVATEIMGLYCIVFVRRLVDSPICASVCLLHDALPRPFLIILLTALCLSLDELCACCYSEPWPAKAICDHEYYCVLVHGQMMTNHYKRKTGGRLRHNVHTSFLTLFCSKASFFHCK